MRPEVRVLAATLLLCAPPVAAADTGFATFYARHFSGRRTASGDRFDGRAMVGAHPTYPLGTLVRVTNLRNHRTVQVRIVDRGPTRRARRHEVIIDLSRAAAEKLGFLRSGRTRVRVDVVRWGSCRVTKMALHHSC